MKYVLSIIIMCSMTPANAHDVVQGSSAVLHVALEMHHFVGFIFLGATAGLFANLFGRRITPWVIMLPFILLASHSHISLFEGYGVLFAMGFLATGYAIAIAVACVVDLYFKQYNPSPRRMHKRRVN